MKRPVLAFLAGLHSTLELFFFLDFPIQWIPMNLEHQAS